MGGSSTQDEVEDIEDDPLVRHRSRRMSSGSVDSGTEIRDTEDSPPSSPQHDPGSDRPQHNATDIGLEEVKHISFFLPKEFKDYIHISTFEHDSITLITY